MKRKLPCPIWQPGCGCPWMAEEAAGERKQRLVADAFMGLPAEIQPTVLAEQTEHYRSKVTFVAKTLNGTTILGAYQRGSHFVMDLRGCVIEEPAIATAADWLRDQVQNVPAYDENTRAGSLRYVVLRSTAAGEVMVTLIGPEAEPAWAKQLAAKMVDGLAQVRGVAWSQNADPGNAIWRGEVHTLAGRARIEEQIDGLRFALSAQSFFQVHRAQASRLRDAMLVALGDVHGREVWDLFCGAGANALRIAKAGARVSGLESVAAAVSDAIENASTNGVIATFQLCDLEKALPKGLPAPHAVVLNPPRRGASPGLIDAIADLAPEKILYIGCAPKPVAMAASRLLSRSYIISSVTPFDLFPHTEHVETLAVFTRQTSL